MSGETAEGCVQVHLGEALARYGFGEGHPFGSDLAAAWCNVVEAMLESEAAEGS